MEFKLFLVTSQFPTQILQSANISFHTQVYYMYSLGQKLTGNTKIGSLNRFLNRTPKTYWDQLACGEWLKFRKSHLFYLFS